MLHPCQLLCYKFVMAERKMIYVDDRLWEAAKNIARARGVILRAFIADAIRAAVEKAKASEGDPA